MIDLLSWFLAIIATSVITDIIVYSVVISPIRNFVAKLAIANLLHQINIFVQLRVIIFSFFTKLITCFFCTSCWVSLIMAFGLPFDIPFVYKWFGLCGLANWWFYLFLLLRDGRCKCIDVNINGALNQG